MKAFEEVIKKILMTEIMYLRKEYIDAINLFNKKAE